MKKLFQYFKGCYKELILGPVFKLTEAIFELFVPLLMAKIIDVGIAQGDSRYVVKMGLFMLLLGAVGLACALTCQYFAALVAYGFGRQLRNDMFRHVMTFSKKETDTLGTDSLITRLIGDANQVQTAVNMFIRLAIRAPFLTIGSIVMAFTINAKIALIFLIALAFIALILYVVMTRSVPYYRAMQKKQDKISLITGENLEGVRVIRAFSRQKEQIERFGSAGDDFANTALRVGKLSAMLNPFTYTVANFAIIAIVWFGSKLAYNGVLASGEIIALVSYMTQSLLALVVFANLVVLFTKATASAGRVLEVLNTEVDVTENAAEAQPEQSCPKIEFDDVSFSYEKNGELALENMSFAIQAGQTVGVIGGTGCGKSTVVHLINRFYDADRGCIKIDGVNIKDYSFAALRKKIGLVPQKAALFTGSIRKNMQFGKQEATDEEIWWALEVAQSADFVRQKSNGLDEVITEGGKNVSGGQKQRLTIARAIVHSPE
ncbi:MAG: ABC transporter ATP-binding protein, partial [Oscillospiraceae bacterium]|nr:ABC transporter ATP-binding protein [Oscillospiraceae bacterium]